MAIRHEGTHYPQCDATAAAVVTQPKNRSKNNNANGSRKFRPALSTVITGRLAEMRNFQDRHVSCPPMAVRREPSTAPRFHRLLNRKRGFQHRTVKLNSEYGIRFAPSGIAGVREKNPVGNCCPLHGFLLSSEMAFGLW